MRQLAGYAACSLLATMAAAAADAPGAQYALSIYSAPADGADGLFSTGAAENATPGGYAIVRERRPFELKAGRNVVVVGNLSRYVDPAALTARALGEGAAEILSQRFDDDPLSLDALVQRHIGHPVDVAAGSGAAAAMVSGTLLSNSGGLTIQAPDGRIVTITEFSRIAFPDLPKGLGSTPSLRWTIDAKQAGTQLFEIVYPTQGLAWRAEYAGWLASGDCRLSLSGWAQVANRSGTDFSEAQIKLIAGEPHHVAATAPAPRMLARAASNAALQAGDSGMAGDYHEYTLDQRVDLPSGTLTRAALFAEQALPCRREYLFEGAHLRVNPGMAPITDRGYGIEPPSPVRATLAFKSERALPAGRLRILQADGNEAPQFVGEDNIGHTPKGAPLDIELGNAFDVRGERRQTDFQIDKDHRTLTESFSVRLGNGGAVLRNVVVREHLYRWTQWAIVQSSTKYAKQNADTVDFAIDVPANGTASVAYTVQYQWSESLR